MNYKRGFTLIELLAVIVILAIIALIATPIVLKIINDSKESSAIRSAEIYMDSVEKSIVSDQFKKMDQVPGIYNVTEKGIKNISNNKEIEVKIKGNKPTNGTITIDKTGKITSAVLVIDKTGLSINENGKIEQIKNEQLCTKASGVNLSALNYGDAFTCELGDGENNTFYLLEQKGELVSLIMDKNIGDTVAWVSKDDYIQAGGTELKYGDKGNNDLGPITAINYLKNQTKTWTKLLSSQIDMPTAHQIANAVGKLEEWNKKPYIIQSLPNWLRTNIKVLKKPEGYWTKTSNSSNPYYAWQIVCGGSSCSGHLYDGYYTSVDVSNQNRLVSTSDKFGVRPVITILKSNIK